MPRTISASEAKNRLGAAIEWVLQNRDEVIVENHGEPRVVIMSFAEYERIKDLREQARQQDAVQRLRKLREKVRARNQDIATEEQALTIADQLNREAINSLVEKGTVSFELE